MSISRRSVLLAGACTIGVGMGLAACGADEAGTGSGPAQAGTAEPDDAVITAAARAEAELIAAYDAVIASASDPLLVAIRAEHVAHLEALGAPTIQVAVSTARTPADLRELERAAALRCRSSCAQARGPELVRTLTFIAASEAAHAPALGRLG